MGYTQTAFGELVGVTKKSQMLYESNQRLPKADYLTAAASIGVDTQYLLTGQRSVSPAMAQSGWEPNGSHDGYSPVPMYDIEAAAGAGRLIEHENIESTLYFETRALSAEGLDPAHLIGAKVRGDSMGSTLQDGDRVIVDCSQRTPDGVFLLRVGEEYRIKRVQRVAGGAWLLISDNQAYEKEMIKPDEMQDVEILGRCRVRIGRIL
ncbi:S24 family peptidase [Chromohalobacter sp.]|uniref:XRE family transcriptional regulator n=1 Tax=Chromohalobacter sp. TaxID=50740 RepID=UPI003242E169